MDILLTILVIIGGSCLMVLIISGGMLLYGGFMEKGISKNQSKIYTTLIIVSALAFMVCCIYFM